MMEMCFQRTNVIPKKRHRITQCWNLQQPCKLAGRDIDHVICMKVFCTSLAGTLILFSYVIIISSSLARRRAIIDLNRADKQSVIKTFRVT